MCHFKCHIDNLIHRSLHLESYTGVHINRWCPKVAKLSHTFISLKRRPQPLPHIQSESCPLTLDYLVFGGPCSGFWSPLWISGSLVHTLGPIVAASQGSFLPTQL